MGHRERQRADRRKRKRRSAERASEGDASQPAAALPAAANGAAPESAVERRNRQAREALAPLRESERPRVVTVGAIIATLIALSSTVSAVLAIAGTEIDGSQPRALPLAMFAAGLIAMAWGMWRARYWAVLGFQALLVLLMLSAAAGLLLADSAPELVATGVLLIGAAVLFYFMVKALARIQMPQRLPPA